MNLRKTILVIVLFASVGGCDYNSATDKQDGNSVSVTDYSGALVSLEKPAQRIIALAPHIVENVYSAGAGDYLIGVIEHSDFPKDALELPIVGSFDTINYEKILKLNPDLIIAWQSGGTHSSILKLQELGFKVYIDQPENLRDIAKSILDIGILTSVEAVARPMVESYLLKIETIISEQKNKAPVSVFYQVWNQPLQTINGNHLISAAMNICGGINIFANEIAVAPIVNIESILEKNPDIIIASGAYNRKSLLFNEWLQWSSLSAVENQHLFNINPDHIQRHSLRVLLGINEFCSHFEIVRASSD